MRAIAASRRHRGVGVDRPVDERVEGQFVLGDVDAGRLAGLQRGLLDQEARTGPSRPARLIESTAGIAGEHIGEAGGGDRRRSPRRRRAWHPAARAASGRPKDRPKRQAATATVAAGAARRVRGRRENSAAHPEARRACRAPSAPGRQPRAAPSGHAIRREHSALRSPAPRRRPRPAARRLRRHRADCARRRLPRCRRGRAGSRW